MANDGAGCADTIALGGSDSAVEELRAALRTGALATSRSPSCSKARLDIAPQADRWLVTLSFAGQEVHRTVATIPLAATWAEAWLLPALAMEPASVDPPEPPATRSALEAREAEPSTGAPQPAPSPPPLIIQEPPGVWLAVVPNGVVADDGSLGAGGDVAVKLQLATYTWLGARLGGVWDTGLTGPVADNDALMRYELLASVRGGMRVHVNAGAELLFGLGFGLGAATSGRHVNGDIEDREEGGPIGEALLELHMDVASRTQLISSLGVRWHILRAGGPDTGSAEQAALPSPVNTVSAALGLGIGYDLGGSP
jgi:hypothetical protein